MKIKDIDPHDIKWICYMSQINDEVIARKALREAYNDLHIALDIILKSKSGYVGK